MVLDCWRQNPTLLRIKQKSPVIAHNKTRQAQYIKPLTADSNLNVRENLYCISLHILISASANSHERILYLVKACVDNLISID